MRCSASMHESQMNYRICYPQPRCGTHKASELIARVPEGGAEGCCNMYVNAHAPIKSLCRHERCRADRSDRRGQRPLIQKE